MEVSTATESSSLSTSSPPSVGQSDTPQTPTASGQVEPIKTGISISVPKMSAATSAPAIHGSNPGPTQFNPRNEGIVAGNDQSAAPTVNTSAVPAFGAASTMTPTTTNFGFNATLTPMGDDKVVAQKTKQTKKKAAGGDGETAKKPSPRVRSTAPKGEKAEKRKASPGRAAATSNATGNAAQASAPPVGQSGQPTPGNSAASGITGSPDSTPPSEDLNLRRTYLQSIYRQLQMTHRNQDDASVRLFATNIEIDICSRAKTKNEYIALMNQHIGSLMQAELANGSAGLQSSLYVPGQSMTSSSLGLNGQVSTSSSMPMTSSGMYSQSSYAPVSSAPVQQRTPAPSQGSFMSLLSGQGPTQSYETERPPPPFPAGGARPPHYSTTGGTPAFPNHQPTPIAKAETPSSQPTQATYHDPRSSSTPTMSHAPAEFANRFQRLDRNGLIDLLWTQHKTVVQYQSRLQALESHLRSSTGSAPPNSSNGPNQGGFYGGSPPPSGPGVPPSLSAEAEHQRANERRLSRSQQQSPNHYGSSPSGQSPYQIANQAVPTPTSAQNPAQYWEKVRYLKEAYLRPLYVAHQALSQHSAPTSSTQGMKAENVKHNISLACSILSETPKPIQPRPIEVLESIERFIQTTVVPIVRKVQPMQPIPPTPGSQPGTMPGSQHTLDVSEGQRSAFGTAVSSQPQPILSNDVAEPSTAKPSAKSPGVKGATKSGGKKSPSTSTKKTTPKTTTPRSTPKTGAKKASNRSGAKQTAQLQGTSIAAPPVPEGAENVSYKSEAANASASGPNPANEDSTLSAIRGGGEGDDDGLNDFADFDDLDFGDDLQDPLGKVQQNKETPTEVTTRKRSIEDV